MSELINIISKKKQNIYLFKKANTKKICFRLFISVILLFIPIYSFTQDNELQFRNPFLKLSDNDISSIIQDHHGYMWFGTGSGLNKSDGVNMLVYNKVVGDTNSLSNNKVFSIYESKNNELWIGTSFGLNLYNREKDSFTRYYHNQSKINNYGYNSINEILEDAKGNIWLATNAGVCIFDKEKKEIVAFNEYCKNNEKVTKFHTEQIINTNEDKILAGTRTGEIILFDIETGKTELFNFDNGIPGASFVKDVNCLACTSDGIIWAGTVENGLFRINEMKNGHIWYEHYSHTESEEDGLSINFIECLKEYRKGKLLVGTTHGGLNILDYSKNEIHIYKYNSFKDYSIGGNSIWSLYKDKANRIWIGIFNVGINIIDSIPKKFNSYKNNGFDKKSLTKGAITSFLEDSLGNIWITSDGGGLDYWNRKTGEFKHFTTETPNQSSISSNAALCLMQTSFGETWLGCFAGGINIINSENKPFKHQKVSEHSPSDDVFAMTEDENGLIYIGTYGAGLCIYDPNSEKKTFYSPNQEDNTSIASQDINVLYFDSNKNLWIGHNGNGLDLLRKESTGNNHFVNFSHNPGDIKSISDNTILAIHEDKYGYLWLGTTGGLNKMNLKTKNSETYTISDGLPHNTIVGILEDDEENLWLSTLDGIAKFNLQEKSIKKYNVGDGLQGQKFTSRAAYYKTSKGELFFGGNEGFTYFHPESLQYDHTFPDINIIDFKIFNKKVPIGNKKSTLQKHIAETSEINLTHKQSVFTLEYVAILHADHSKIQYAYKLEGLEDSWNYVGGERRATYTNLDPGTYIFKVKSTNLEGDWNENSRNLIINVLPPWWNTSWFKLILVIGIITIIMTIYKLRTRSLRHTQKVLESKISERTKELRLANQTLLKKQEEIHFKNEKLEAREEEYMQLNEELKVTNDLLNLKNLELKKAFEKMNETHEKLKNTQSQLVLSEKMASLGILTAGIAHEINNPLNFIQGGSFALGEYINENLSEHKNVILPIVNTIDQGVKRTAEIINSLNRFSRISDKMNEICDISSIIKNCLVMLENLIKHRIEIIENYTNTAYKLVGDESELHQVFLNVLTNAVQAIEGRGIITINTEVADTDLMVNILDTGIGIKPENLKKITDPFYTTKPPGEGTGLGMSIAYSIIKKHKGTISYKSEESRGTHVTITFPLT